MPWVLESAQLMVANRLIEPLSEWALIDWSHRTALPEMLGIRITKTTKDRLYQTSDFLLAHRKELEQKLRHREAELLDAGFASASNIHLLKERGYSYLINITRDRRLKYAAQFTQDGFEPLPGRTPEMQVEVRRIPDPEDAQSSLILCRSAQRCAKETAMLSKAETRFLTDLEALRKLITTGELKKPDIPHPTPHRQTREKTPTRRKILHPPP